MGQFKPMVKMMTTEPTVELKLKKGGSVKKADGGYMPMQSSMPAMPMPMPARGGMMPSAAPKKPSMASRRAAMAAMAATPRMKNGGESKGVHKAEMSKMKGLEKELKSHENKPASKGHKGLATGGVVYGQGGFKKGGLASSGIINTEGQGGEYRNTKMVTAKPDHSPAKTGEVKMGNGGGYKKGGMAMGGDMSCATGGVTKSNGGGYRKGGATKKFAEGGAVQDDGKAVKMKQGSVPVPPPVSITALSGTYKKGGKVTKAEGRLQKAFKSENATAMKEAKMYTNEKYPKSASIRKNEGGVIDAKAVSDKASRELEEALNPISMAKELYGKARDYISSGSISNKDRDMVNKSAPKGSITQTQKSVTVTPSKKRGGSVKC